MPLGTIGDGRKQIKGKFETSWLDSDFWFLVAILVSKTMQSRPTSCFTYVGTRNILTLTRSNPRGWRSPVQQSWLAELTLVCNQIEPIMARSGPRCANDYDVNGTLKTSANWSFENTLSTMGSISTYKKNTLINIFDPRIILRNVLL